MCAINRSRHLLQTFLWSGEIAEFISKKLLVCMESAKGHNLERHFSRAWWDLRKRLTPPLSIFHNWMLRELSDSVSFLGREPNTHCQSLFSLNSVYPKWPCSRSWPFLSLDVLISWIKLCSWSQSNGYSHKPREVLISSVFAGVTYSFIYNLLLAGVGTLHHCSHLPRN